MAIKKLPSTFRLSDLFNSPQRIAAATFVHNAVEFAKQVQDQRGRARTGLIHKPLV